MDMLGVILITILVVSLILIVTWDPLEKYDKNLDDPDAKKFEGAYRDLRLGPWPKVWDKRKEKHGDNKFEYTSSFYTTKKVKIAGLVGGVGVVVALIGAKYYPKNAIPGSICLLLIGGSALLFNRDLAMERVVNHRLNPKYYWFARGMSIFVGVIFIFAGIAGLFGH